MKHFISIITIAFILVTSMYGQWEILNEGIEGELRTIDFVSEEIGWLAGHNGTLLKTEDGGLTWFRIAINEAMDIDWDIEMIDFLNDSVGWAMGKNFIVRSQNGGKTWSVQTESIQPIYAIYAVSNSVIYASGKDLILKTSDGGTSWVDMFHYGESKFLRSVWFINSKVGFVTGTKYDSNTDKDKGILLRTSDGGETWDERVIAELIVISDLQFINDSTGYFLAYEDQTESTKYLLCATTDTFNTWSTSYASDYPIIDYHFLDKNIAYLLRKDSTNNNVVMTSKNGGVTWLNISLQSNLTRVIFAINDADVFLFGSGGRRGQNAVTLLKSDNHGSDWVTQILTYPFTDVCFLNKDKGVAVGGWTATHSVDGKVFITSDGGKTWDPTFSSGNILKACFFVNDSIGFTISKTSTHSLLRKTIDSGQDWVEVFNYYRSDSLDLWFLATDIWFMNEDIGWTVGGDGDKAIIIHTTDGGETWEEEWQSPWPEDNNGWDYRLSSVYFANDTTGWAVGEGGLMVKYTETSQWQAITSVTDLPLNDVFFSDENHGWIAGGYINDQDFQSVLLRTSNGGETWQEKKDLNFQINDMFFADSLHGWAVGSSTSETGDWRNPYHGIILETEDGGENWTLQVGNLAASLTAIHFKDGFGWAVGGNGLVLRTEDGVSWVDQNSGKTYPNKFSLSQNYPNPFNPKTAIEYQLPKSSQVELSIYNLLGQKIEILVNKNQPAGSYKVEWDASGFASGVYFCRLETDNGFIQTKKLVFLK